MAALLFEESDQLIMRLEESQKTYPQLIVDLQTSTDSAAEAITSALTEVEKRSAPALLQAIQTKAREAHAQMVATVADAARDSAAQALRGEANAIVTALGQLVERVRCVTQEMRRDYQSRLLGVAIVSALVSAATALLVVWVIIGLR